MVSAESPVPRITMCGRVAALLENDPQSAIVFQCTAIALTSYLESWTDEKGQDRDQLRRRRDPSCRRL